MPEFQNPAAFLLLLLGPLLLLLRYFKIFKKVSFLAVLSDWNGKAFKWNGKARKILSLIGKFFVFTGFFLSVTALADPVRSYQEKVYTSLGTDIVFVVDTSPSMAATDMDGMSRLESAKRTIKNLAIEQEGLRFGMVVLGSEASVFVPPTADHSAFLSRIDDVAVGILGNGSAIGDGLSTAVCHLVSSVAPKKVIVLLTDGENNAGQIHPETAAGLAARNDISVYVVGIGSKGTVPIEYVDPLTGKQYSGYLDSNYNSASLKKIATIGGGRYFEVTNLQDFATSFNLVTKNEGVNQNYTYRTVTQSLYKKILFWAIILFVIGWFIKRIILKEMLSFKYRKILILRSVFLVLGFIMLLLAQSGIHWGTYLVPVQKNGVAVGLVYDISNSMLASDGPDNISRLKASCEYSKVLLDKMNGVSASVVLAKGDGITAIPVTDDYTMIQSLLDVMSPSLMTVPGSSIGKGIIKAKESFPSNYSNAGRIWVFTDGEETDNHLKSALSECIKAGIPVTIIGFGDEKESQVLAGDGKTYVSSALRTEKIISTIEEAKKNLGFYKNQTEITYINSTEKGSAVKLLNQLKTGAGQIISYEAKPVPRYKLFLLLAVLFYAFSYIFTEFDFKKIVRNVKSSSSYVGKIGIIFSVLIILSVTGCSKSTVNILKGSYACTQKQYEKAVSYYHTAQEQSEKENNLSENAYALYDLGTAYLLLDEKDAAMEKFALISEDAPVNVRYSAFYNAGIIAHQNEDYDKALEYFKKALEVDSTRIEAKINLELTIQSAEVDVRQNESKVTPSADDDDTNQPDMEKAVFERIRENDQKQWKNSESNQTQNLADDY